MIGEKLGSYRIEAILGTGAMGVVYRALSEATNRPAAVKVIGGEITQKSKTYERFRREAEILQQFRHPNIVRFLAVGRYKGTSYFAMEYVAGETLEQWLRSRGSIPWREVVDLGIQLSEALHYAHEHSVVHRDLKPSNLMVNEKGQLKLTDFGIAKDLDATALTATGRTLGTAAYMAPEQIRGTPEVSHKTDLYAMGVVLYQMLTGNPPFEGTSAVVLMHAHLNQPPPRPSDKTAEIPVALDKLVVQLMAKDPGDRPWDAAAVAVALTELRDKASRRETVPMVWPADGDPAGMPARAGTEVPKKAKKKAKPARGLVIERSVIEVGLLVLGLFISGGLIAYVVWPPSAPYLYQHAERLMNSGKATEADRDRDHQAAVEEYVEPLDRRFPDNPYRAKTGRWRDQVALDAAMRRGRVLESPLKTAISEPQDVAEQTYVFYQKEAAEAEKKKDDLAAHHAWDEMAKKLKPDDPVERRWFLLANKRADDLRKDIERRRELVLSLFSRAAASAAAGRSNEAASVQANLIQEYGQYTSLADLFPKAPPESPSAPSPPGSSAPASQPVQGSESPPK
jgi:hypothetical protein